MKFATVSAARSGSYDLASSEKPCATLDSLEPLPAIAVSGRRVLVKVNLGCSARSPQTVSHSTRQWRQLRATRLVLVFLSAMMSRAGQYCEAVYKVNGMP
jgi:hypothetical protein